jgi:predicted nucleotidyltransferase
MVTQEMLQVIVNQIVEIAHPQKIILFGSFARNTMTNDSDIDLVVIKKMVIDKIDEIIEIKRRIRSKDFSIDLILVSEKDFNTKLAEGWTIYQDIQTEGIIMYAA